MSMEIFCPRLQSCSDANSDLYLVKTLIRLQLSTYKNKFKPRLDVERLKNKDINTKYKV